MHSFDLTNRFQREVEVLELNEHYMTYAIDQKTEEKDLCSIETIDFQTEEIKRHITLDYTRLYESFRTFSQMKDFFYGVNVLADYRLRLRKVNKRTWNVDMDILIQPEGEIINIYSLNEDYMIIYDEVKAEPVILEKYNIQNKGHRYVNVRYLYEIKTGKKYPIKDRYFDSLTEEIPICNIQGVNTLIYEVFYKEEAMEHGDATSMLLMTDVDSFIAHVKSDGSAGFKVIAQCDENFNYLRRMYADDHKVVYRQRNYESGYEQMVVCYLDSHEFLKKEVIFEYTVPKEGEVYYDLNLMKVYYCPDEEDAPLKYVQCLNDPSLQWTYDGKYGSFAFALDRDSFVTTYYEEVFLKEYEYHEYAAVHTKQGIDAFEGKCDHMNNTVIKLRSFLAL